MKLHYTFAKSDQDRGAFNDSTAERDRSRRFIYQPVVQDTEIFFNRSRDQTWNSIDFIVGTSALALSPGDPRPPEVMPTIAPNEIEEQFIIKRKWQGVVQEIKPCQSFKANLSDLSLSDIQDDISTEFEFEEVPEDDHYLIRLGAVFYWSIGHRRARGQVERSSRINFRRVGRWSAKEVNKIISNAKELRDAITEIDQKPLDW